MRGSSQGTKDLPQLAVVHILGSSSILDLRQAARRQDSSPGTSWLLARTAPFAHAWHLLSRAATRF